MDVVLTYDEMLRETKIYNGVSLQNSIYNVYNMVLI